MYKVPHELTFHGRFGNVSMGEVLGSGTFGIVFKGYHYGLKQVVAVKMLDLNKFKRSDRKKQREKLEREIKIMKECEHQHILRLLDSVQDGKSKFLLVVPFCAGGDLHLFMENRKFPLEEEDAQRFAKQIASGLLYLHSRNPPIIHRDLKPQNILMSESKKKATVFIADFGEAQFKREVAGKTALQTFTGTFPYMAPEIVAARYDAERQYQSCGKCIYLSVPLYLYLCTFKFNDIPLNSVCSLYIMFRALTQWTCGLWVLLYMRSCSRATLLTVKTRWRTSRL